MEYLGKLDSTKDIASKEYVAEYVAQDGGKINYVAVDGVDLPISAAKRVDIDLTGKVDKSVTGTNGVAEVVNASNGSNLTFTHTDGTITKIAVKDGGNNGVSAQLSSIKNGEGVRLNIENGAIYYIKGADRAVTEDDEIVTAGNVPHPTFSIVKQADAEEGYFATYYLEDKHHEVCGVKINIPKDFLIKSAELKTCVVDDVPVEGFKIGDKYIDFTVNSKDSAEQETHIYINVKDLVDVYKAGNGIDVTNNTVSAKVVAANGLSVDAEGIKMSLADNSNNGAMSSAFASKLNGIEEGAQKNVQSDWSVTDDSADAFINNKPVNVSVFTNDAGYLTSHQSLDGYATESWVEGKGYLTSHQSLAAYRTSADQDTIDATKALATDLTAHTGDTDIHVTLQNKNDWDSKATPEMIPTELSAFTEDATHRVVTDEEKTAWNAKSNGTITSDISVTNAIGSYSAGDTIASGTSIEEIIRNMLTAKA